MVSTELAGAAARIVHRAFFHGRQPVRGEMGYATDDACRRRLRGACLSLRSDPNIQRDRRLA
jgi:hypothetical protein